MLFDFTVAAVIQHIFSSVRYCSYFITLEIEPRNIIIDLYVGYHCEQENKWFSASVSISLTKIIGWVHFYLCALRDDQLVFQAKKEDYYSRGWGGEINFCFYLEFEEKKGKRYYSNGTSISSFLLNASEPGRSHFPVIYSYSNFTGIGFGRGGETICEEQGKDSCLC